MSELLSFRGVSKRFGGVRAVEGLSFGLDRGESLGLIGPNGAGKTTSFSLIMGEFRPDEGELLFEGRDITRDPVHARVKRGICRTYQVPRPFGELTVADNIQVAMMPDDLAALVTQTNDRAAEREIADRVGFSPQEFLMYPGELSMGSLRRLELARTIAAKPKLMLLDEVFAGLTFGEIGRISETLGELRKEGMSFVIVSHDLRSLAPLVDRVVVMSFGSKIAEGALDEAIADEKVREAYLGSVPAA